LICFEAFRIAVIAPDAGNSKLEIGTPPSINEEMANITFMVR